MEGGIEIANLSHVSCPTLVLVACFWTWGFSMAFRFFKREKQNVKGSPRVEAIVQLRILTSYTPSYLIGSKCFPLSSQHLDPIWILETRLPCTQITYNSSCTWFWHKTNDLRATHFIHELFIYTWVTSLFTKIQMGF